MRAKLLVVAFLIAACPGSQVLPDTSNPYAVARAVIQSAQLSLYAADSLFGLWASRQSDPARVAAATARYQTVRAAVSYGLSLALRAVDLAEKAKAKVELAVILKDADEAWKDLRGLLTVVFGQSSPPASAPASEPTRSPDKWKLPTLDDLPTSLIPLP
jgi:hypothetical protein